MGVYHRAPQYRKAAKICPLTRQPRAIFSHKPPPSDFFSKVNVLVGIAIICKLSRNPMAIYLNLLILIIELLQPREISIDYDVYPVKATSRAMSRNETSHFPPQSKRETTRTVRLNNIFLQPRCISMDRNKLRILMRTFITSQFQYCPLVWMLHNKQVNKKINKIQERALRITYKDTESTFSDLKDVSKKLFDV